ncbi:MAG: hypothetical protein AAGG44_20960, partial [Planctomycetota bacterium]
MLTAFASLFVIADQAVAQSVTLSRVSEGVAIDDDALPSATAIDRYIQKPDASYEWKIVNQVETPSRTYVSVRFTSQTWLT